MRFALLALVLAACTHPPPCPELPAVVAECALRVRRECPDLKPGECEPQAPCPKCRALEECDRLVLEKCR